MAGVGAKAMRVTGQAGPAMLAAYGKAADAREPAKKKGPEAEALDQLKKDMKAGRKTAIGDAKGRARERMQQVIEKLKMIRKLYAEDPKGMAKALAAVAKELQGAVKAYAKAAKDAGEMFAQDFAAAPDASLPPEGQDAARKDLEDQARAEADGDMDFIKNVRSLSNALRDDLQTAKTKGILTQPGKFERSDEVKDAEDGLKELDQMTEDLDRQVRRDMPPGSLMKVAA